MYNPAHVSRGYNLGLILLFAVLELVLIRVLPI